MCEIGFGSWALVWFERWRTLFSDAFWTVETRQTPFGNIDISAHHWVTETNADFNMLQIFLTELQFDFDLCQFKPGPTSQSETSYYELL